MVWDIKYFSRSLCILELPKLLFSDGKEESCVAGGENGSWGSELATKPSTGIVRLILLTAPPELPCPPPPPPTPAPQSVPALFFTANGITPHPYRCHTPCPGKKVLSQTL